MRKHVIALIALGLGLAAGCSAATQSTTTPVDRIAVTYVTAPLNVPSIVERRTGTFDEAFGRSDVDVTYAELTTGPEQTAALASGDIQFLFGVGATSVILSAANGADIVIVDAYSRSPEAFSLITAADGPRTPEDLAGLTVGGPKGTILHELLAAYLDTGGVDIADVDHVDMTIPAAQAALAGGSIDVALLAGPVARTMLDDGYQEITDGSGLVGATIVVATTRAFADAHPDMVATFRAAHRSVLDAIAADVDGALATAADETGLPDQAVATMYGMYDFGADLTAEDLDALDRTVQFLLDHGMLEEPVAVEDLLLDADAG